MNLRAIFVVLVCGCLLSPGADRAVRGQMAAPDATPQGNDDASIAALLNLLQQALLGGDPSDYLALQTPTADLARARSFADSEIRPGATRAVVVERDRTRLTNPLRGQGYRILVDIFVEHGGRARIGTWQFDLSSVGDLEWRIDRHERISGINSVYRLSVDRSRQYEARDFRIVSEDLELTLVEGSVFMVNTDQGTTGLVLMGRGNMRFRPAPETERGQVRIFADSETLETRFDVAYVRVGNLGLHADPSLLVRRPVNARDLRRAEEIFLEESPKTYTLGLGDLSPEAWWVLPAAGDFQAEIRTRGKGTLTYGRSQAESEDISLIDRSRQRHVASYASVAKLAERGRLYDEDDPADYEVIDYDIDLTIAPTPRRQIMEGRATLRLKTLAPLTAQLTFRLADSLEVQSVSSAEFGRLFHLRVTNQHILLVSLPAALVRDTEFSVTITYRGALAPQTVDREALTFDQSPPQRSQGTSLQDLFARIENTYLYSSRSYWYPQPPVTDYATATLRITLPASLSCVASGELSVGSPTLVPERDGMPALKMYEFNADRPVRYLALLISRLVTAERATIRFEDRPGETAASAGVAGIPGKYDALDLVIEAQPLQAHRGGELIELGADIARYYQSLLGDSPYSSLTLVLVESTLPGGHSPAYFAALNQPAPDRLMSWRGDPAYFEGFPEFFIAHEIAHQWWGQAVGWRNYHEQWLSEGFSQYFAALYASHSRGDDLFEDILRQFRRWALSQSDQGPVYLGARLGHIRGDSRVFRALVYNKGAAVLHMLRRLIGDEAFFRGVRRFYTESRYDKSGTRDLRLILEAESGQPLERFFERWIYGSTLPQISFSYDVERVASGGAEVVLRFEQQGELFDVPVTVVLDYSGGPSVEVVVPVTERTVEMRLPLEGNLRRVRINNNDGMVAEIREN